MNDQTDKTAPTARPAQEAANFFAAAQAQAALLSGLAVHHGMNLTRAVTQATAETMTGALELAPQLTAKTSPDALKTYVTDVRERGVLFSDTLRQRGDNAIRREEAGLKPVLAFDYEMVIDGRDRERPVNYALVRITPPEGYPEQREDGRPWVIIDPRAGHGSGIGGFKSDSEVGVALKDGHPVYFVIFYAEPEKGQTLADVTAAEAGFLEEVIRRHPEAPQPLVTGNCQGGWAAMILAATHPQLVGPVVIAGAPLSYWAGEVGKNPFRYYGGLAGGAVPALLSSDLGGGTFDGANLVMNFEQMNPGRNWFRKNYDLYSDAPGGAERFLDFERWWSGFYFMNEAEIRWIVENLFVGNKLTRGLAVLNDGTPVDLKDITAPVVVFASHGDNITPPQQALNWIPDLYPSVDELRARGHIIIYTLHDSVGHLGIFVSAKVATTQHKQITSVMKTIESLAPGLYEMKIDEGAEGFEVNFEGRTIDDILALGGDRAEEQEFPAVAKFSELAVKQYELTLRPLLRAAISPQTGQMMRKMHPMRAQISAFSSKNPVIKSLESKAAAIRADRQRVAADNPFLAAETYWADVIERNWNLYRDWRDAMIELTFHTIWGAPWMIGLATQEPERPVVRDIRRLPEVERVLDRVGAGGYPEAILRMLVLLARARGSVRRERLERSNAMLHSRAPFESMPADERAQMIHEQTLIVDLAGKDAITALPDMLRDDVDRIRALDLCLEIAGPIDEMDAKTIAMFEHLQTVLRARAKGWRRAHEAQIAVIEAESAASASPSKKTVANLKNSLFSLF